MAKVTAVTPVFPDTRLLRFLLKSQNSENELTQTVFRTEDAGLLPESVVSALWTSLPRWWGVCRGVTGMLVYCWAPCLRCACAVQERPLCVQL